MTRFSNIVPVLLFLLFFSTLKSQEFIIKVPFSQPGKLTVNAGDNQVLETGQTLILGNDVSISGGTPEYQYTWKDILGNEYSSATIPVTEAGSYHLMISDVNLCSAADSVEVTLFSSTDGNEAGSGFEIFPNPSEGVFYFRLNNPDVPAKLEVISPDGRVVVEQRIRPSQGGTEGTIDLTDVGKGLFHIKLTRKGDSLTKSIIIR